MSEKLTAVVTAISLHSIFGGEPLKEHLHQLLELEKQGEKSIEETLTTFKHFDVLRLFKALRGDRDNVAPLCTALLENFMLAKSGMHKEGPHAVVAARAAITSRSPRIAEIIVSNPELLRQQERQIYESHPNRRSAFLDNFVYELNMRVFAALYEEFRKRFPHIHRRRFDHRSDTVYDVVGKFNKQFLAQI